MVELVTMNLILVLLLLAYESLICLVVFSCLYPFLTPVRIVVYSDIDGVGGDAGIYC